jgi:hypothetical protein
MFYKVELLRCNCSVSHHISNEDANFSKCIFNNLTLCAALFDSKIEVIMPARVVSADFASQNLDFHRVCAQALAETRANEGGVRIVRRTE